MIDFSSDIENILQATSLILVFISIFFTMFFPQIQKDINIKVPKKEIAREDHRKYLLRSIAVKCIPLLLITGTASWLFSSLFFQAIDGTHIELWNFDFTRSAVVFIATMIFLFFGWSVLLTIQIAYRIYETINDVTS